MIRILDIFFSFIGLLLGLPLFFVLAIFGWIDTRSPFFFQTRVGKNQHPFTLVKFRTMRPNTASVATHLANPSSVTAYGSFLRRVKLDELPQLWNVLKGDMSLIGPRPCLPNQNELIQERIRKGVFSVRPGITGLAQLNGIDMSEPRKLADVDACMIQEMSCRNYFRYLLLTVFGKGTGDRIRR